MAGMLASRIYIVSCLADPAVLRGVEHRPVYHLISQGAEAGWLSDPNGPIFANGRYHVFYQAATAAEMRAHKQPFHTPDPVSWGHMSSPDLTHWVQHPAAIAPATATSFEGADVYSGATIQDPSDGSVKAYYACGCGDARPPGGHNDAVCYASSTDANLTNWTKFKGNHGSVVLYVPEALGADKDKYVSEAGSQFIFRNETNGGSGWIMMVGSGFKDSNEMATLLFSAPDLKPTTKWTYKGPQYIGGGKHGGAWCPFVAQIDAKHDPHAVVMDYQNWVSRGTIAPPDYTFVPALNPANMTYQWPLLDSGTAHVSAVFVGDEPKGRKNIVLRWLSSHGEYTSHSEQAPYDFVDWGWVGVHSLPFTIGRATGAVQNEQNLSYKTVEEIDFLHVPGTEVRVAAANMSSTAAKAGQSMVDSEEAQVVWHSAVRGVALELQLNVSLPTRSTSTKDGGCNAGIIVRATPNSSEQTTIALWSADAAKHGSSAHGKLIINRTLSSLSTNHSGLPFQEMSLPEAVLGQAISLKVYVDHSVIEVFVGDFAMMSTRAYPIAGNSADRIGTFSGGRCKLGGMVSWQMENVYEAGGYA